MSNKSLSRVAEGQVLILRADAGPDIGTGHLMRSLALCQAWRDAGGGVVLVTSCGSGRLLQRFDAEGAAVIHVGERYPSQGDLRATLKVVSIHPDAWVVLDGYHFDEEYHRSIKDTGHPVMIVDDMAHLVYYYADIILNQNIHAKTLTYRCPPGAKLLLGTEYALLRREFLPWRKHRKDVRDVATKLLVTLGGGAPESTLLELVEEIGRAGVPGLEVIVVLGAVSDAGVAVHRAAKECRASARIVRDATDMPRLMADANLAISAGGTTIWELCFMGVPTLAMILADNQSAIVEAAAREGALRKVALKEVAAALRELCYDRSSRAAMSEAARRLVDGLGARRVVEELLGAGRAR